MYQFSLLTNAKAIFFDKLTYPLYRPLLKVLDTNSSILALGINLDSQPIGLGLTTIKDHKAEILSLFIHPEHREKGLGKKLLSSLEIELQKRGCLQCEVVYVSNATTPTFEQILQQLNWNPPKLRMLVCQGFIENFKDLSWLRLYERLPSGYTIFPWIELTQPDRKFIQEQQSDFLGYPEILSPFYEEESIEPINSLGLRYENKVVGWMITHRVAFDTVRYTRLFVKKELQSLGRGLAILSKSIKLHLEKIEAPKVVFTVEAHNIQMLLIVQKRLSPYLSSIRESRYSLKCF